MARVHFLKETTNDPTGDWQLWFQGCRYELDDGIQYGYRFIWRRPDGALQAARGQARIPNFEAAKSLMDTATAEGWANRDGDVIAEAAKRLEGHGCVVSLTTGYVGWRDRNAALKGYLTPQLTEDSRIIREWSLDSAGRLLTKRDLSLTSG